MMAARFAQSRLFMPDETTPAPSWLESPQNEIPFRVFTGSMSSSLSSAQKEELAAAAESLASIGHFYIAQIGHFQFASTGRRFYLTGTKILLMIGILDRRRRYYMKYFIDGGGHNGCSVRKFVSMYPDWREWIIHSFEPNPKFESFYTSLPSNIVHHSQALWASSCFKDFYVSAHGNASTLIQQKKTGNLDLAHPIRVCCVDFSKWLQDTVSTDDQVIVKLDIEGAEYEVLRGLLQDGSISLIDQLYVEFHYSKIGLEFAEHNRIVERLNKAGLNPEPWDALKFSSVQMIEKYREILSPPL
jgi:FkbM family methyltransferase